ncbi:NUDIX hydrolase [Longispora albida]|uniref:NUDIX hydrolase n=1 Tax=Longispora albida TaxID=203523 RepID=UPI000380D1EF|nr:NUDIX hydrolase N-terminal domain-containing protein [Longispora albida]
MIVDPSVRVAQLADELRAISATSLHFSRDPHDRARFEQIRTIAAELLSVVDPRTAAEIEEVFRGDLAPRSPLVGADAAIFDADGRLFLTDRADGRGWCMPGGLVEVGESPSEAAAREAWEECGLRVRAVELLAVYDNRKLPVDAAFHVLHHVHRCEIVSGEPRLTHEVRGFGWFSQSELDSLQFQGSHVRMVPDMFLAREQAYFH